MRLSRNYNVFGIAKKDKSNDVLIWLKENGDPYKKLGLDEDGLASIEWGVYGLPETFLIDKEGKVDLVIGSAGSNRIRSAIVQVVINYMINEMSLENSISSSRIHLEENNLYLEPTIDIDYNLFEKMGLHISTFSDKNLFFGGVNAVSRDEAVSDSRRGGYSLIC